jgi:hypothetical protein
METAAAVAMKRRQRKMPFSTVDVDAKILIHSRFAPFGLLVQIWPEI